MRIFWKVFAALALMLPLGAFVAGNLVASAANDPEPRHTIIVDDQSSSPSEDASRGPSDAASPSSPRGGADDQSEDQGDDHGGDVGTVQGDDHGDDHGGSSSSGSGTSGGSTSGS